MTRVLFFAALFLLATTSSAHHGSAGQFDHSKTIEVTGVVKKIRFVNPHSYVYFDVTNDQGEIEEWRCEMRAASVLKRSGWSEDMFDAGTVIDIVGNPARREPHGCYVDTLALNEGESIERYAQLEGAEKSLVERERLLPNGIPNLAGNWAAPQRLLTGIAGRGMGPGGPGMGPPRGRSYPQTEAGIAASTGHEDEDNPRFHCMATNIFQDWTFDQHINRIEQDKDSITLTYGFMDIVRTIHLNMDSHPVGIEPSRAGHSIGRWEGETLVVDTVGFAEGYLDGRNGVKHSDQLHVVERFTLSEDGKTLTRSYVGEDPLYLTASFERSDSINATDSAFDPYDCEDLTEEIVPGF
jgi:hypothetical protein